LPTGETQKKRQNCLPGLRHKHPQLQATKSEKPECTRAQGQTRHETRGETCPARNHNTGRAKGVEAPPDTRLDTGQDPRPMG
jgi:hypothetical protein